jgi:flagellar hook-length control protein FliK
MPGIAPAQAAAAPGAADAAGGADGATDFAAVLKAQIGLPAKDAPLAEILAALLPAQATDAAEEAVPVEALPAAPDLSALLPALHPALAALQPQTTKASAVVPENPADGLSALAASTGSASPMADSAPSMQPVAETPAAGEDAASLLRPERQPAGPDAQPMQTEITAARIDAQMPAAAAEHANPAGTAHAAAPLAHAAAAADAPAVVRVDTPVGGRGWDAEVGQKIVLLANRQESRAELTLTPPQLGRVDVSITVNGDQTSAAFVSASPAAREALEQALPRLREILAEAGITLGQASVNAESPRQDGNGTSGERRADDGSAGSAGTANAAAPAQWLRRSEGLIDTFA